MLPLAWTHVDPYAPCPACSLLFSENPPTPLGRTLVTCGLHLPPVHHHDMCAHVELSAVLQTVTGLPLASPWLHLPPVHHHEVCAHVDLSFVLQAVLQAVLGLVLDPPWLHLGPAHLNQVL